jgi:hypothetical protein
MPIIVMMGSRHDGRKEAQRVLHERRDEQPKQSAGNDRAIDAGETKPRHGRHCQHRGDRNRGYAHDDGKADAEWTNTDGLHQGGNAAGEKVGIDQQCKLVFRKMQCAAQNKRHRHCIGIHDQNMLQAQGNHPRRRQHLINWMDRG